MSQRLLLLLLFLITSLHSYSHNFTHFRLKNEMAERNDIYQMLQSQVAVPSATINHSDQITQAIIQDSMLDESQIPHQQGQTVQDNPLSQLLENILGPYLANIFEAIAREQSLRIIDTNREFDLGQWNGQGISWQRPIGGFQISVNRQLRRLLLSGDWLVQDTMTITVEASTFLERLQEADQIDISSQQLQAFAGIAFSRSYKSYHRSATFLSGLTQSFDKLFLPFTRNHIDSFVEFEDGETFQAVNSFRAAVGASISYPLHRLVSVGASITAEYETASEISAQKRDYNLHITSSDSKEGRFAIEGSLQADFFQLIQISLLSVEASWGFKQTHSSHMVLTPQDQEDVTTDPYIKEQMNKLLGHKSFHEPSLAPYISGYDFSRESFHRSRYGFSVWGGANLKSHGEMRLIDSQEVHHVEKAHIRKYREIRNWGGKLSGWLGRLLSRSSQQRHRHYQEYSLDAQAKTIQGNVLLAPDITLESEKFISQDFGKMKRRPKKIFQQWIKKDSLAYEPEIIQGLRSQTLLGPYRINNRVQLHHHAIHHLIHGNQGMQYVKSADICGARFPWDWLHPQSRFLAKQYDTYAVSKCVRRIMGRIDRIQRTFQRHKKFQLNHVLALVSRIYEIESSFSDIQKYFGAQHVTVQGSFSGRLPNGVPFRYTYEHFPSNQTMGELDLINEIRQQQSIGVIMPVFL